MGVPLGILLLVIVVAIFASSVQSFTVPLGDEGGEDSSDSDALKKKFDSPSQTRPNGGGVADVVSVSLDRLSITEVDEDKQSVSLDLILHLSWVDPRVANAVERETLFTLNGQDLPDLWTPGVMIFPSTRIGDDQSSLTLGATGRVDLTRRMSLKLSCPLSQVKYPFGKQTCRMNIQPSGHSTLHLLFLWNGMIASSSESYDPHYSITNVDQFAVKRKIPQDGESSVLVVEFTVVRSSLRIVLLVLIPSFILALVAYIITFSCCLGRTPPHDDMTPVTVRPSSSQGQTSSISERKKDPTVVGPETIKLCANAFLLLNLALIQHFSYLKSPKASLPSAVDIWMGAMGLGVFICCLVSLTTLWRKVNRMHAPAEETESSQVDDDDDDKKSSRSRARRCTNRCMDVDKFIASLRIGLPVIFVLFLVSYVAIFCVFR